MKHDKHEILLQTLRYACSINVKTQHNSEGVHYSRVSEPSSQKIIRNVLVVVACVMVSVNARIFDSLMENRDALIWFYFS